VLTEAGSSIEKVVKVNVFLTDMADFQVSTSPFDTKLAF
jgi:enamine deaminase RidA (YjgF/YER057c/UK114 family)